MPGKAPPGSSPAPPPSEKRGSRYLNRRDPTIEPDEGRIRLFAARRRTFGGGSR
jgi:hypothetical protein